MQSYLTSVISSIKKRATEKGGDIDSQAFWLANTYRLYCDMKQFSGDKVSTVVTTLVGRLFQLIFAKTDLSFFVLLLISYNKAIPSSQHT